MVGLLHSRSDLKHGPTLMWSSRSATCLMIQMHHICRPYGGHRWYRLVTVRGYLGMVSELHYQYKQDGAHISVHVRPSWFDRNKVLTR